MPPRQKRYQSSLQVYLLAMDTYCRWMESVHLLKRGDTGKEAQAGQQKRKGERQETKGKHLKTKENKNPTTQHNFPYLKC